jgi:hypothetical protein
LVAFRFVVYPLVRPILRLCIFCTIEDHALDLCNSCATDSICCLSDMMRLTSKILSFTSASYSFLYALSSAVGFN